jgi:aminoglycoside phosphotransferase (APT) family kinase protein
LFAHYPRTTDSGLVYFRQVQFGQPDWEVLVEKSDVDPRSVLSALGIFDATGIRPVHGGWATSIWRVDRGHDAFALRLFRADQALACGREVAAMRAADAGGIPVPRIHANGFWEDRPVLLLSWCPGQTLLSALEAKPWRVWHLGVAFGRVQARINSLPAPSELNTPPGAWIDLAGPDESKLQVALRNVAANANALLHLDYHPLNVMIDGGRVTGVLDWANARAGDRRADYARTYTFLRVQPDPPTRFPMALALPVLRRLLAMAWRHGYRQESTPLEDLGLFYAWAGAYTARDLEQHLGKPGVWLKPHHLHQIRRWANAWKARTGVSNPEM